MAHTLLAVDLSYQVYRAAASHPDLSSGDTFTGGLYGFMQTLAKAIRETGATRVVVCADRKPYVRSKEYPEYKQLRKRRQDDALRELQTESMPLVLELLDVLGWPLLSVPGFESDDLIGGLVRWHRCRFEHIYAASNDSDLFQLLDAPNFSIFKKDRDSVITARSLWAAYQITPAEYVQVLAMTGTHNDVAGIPRVAEITAIKMLKNPGKMRELLSKGDNQAIYDRNLRLIQLPHRNLARFPLRVEPIMRFNPRSLYSFCSRFDIDATKSMLDSFEQVSE